MAFCNSAAAAELQNAMAKAGYSFHRVILPPQTLEQGRVKLEVVEFKVANIDVTGNHYFSPENIKSSLPRLISGKTPDTSELSRELIIANEHPAPDGLSPAHVARQGARSAGVGHLGAKAGFCCAVREVLGRLSSAIRAAFAS